MSVRHVCRVGITVGSVINVAEQEIDVKLEELSADITNYRSIQRLEKT